MSEKTIGGRLTSFRHYNVIREQIGDLADCSLVHYCTMKKWHSFEMLKYLLSVSGPADVILTTFGLSEEGIRAILLAKEEGYINSLTVVINSVARKYKNKLLHFLRKVEPNIYMENVHLKLFLIRNRQYNIVVNQSANFSTNPTIEAGIVANDEQTYNLYAGWIDDIIKKSRKYELGEDRGIR